MEEKKVIYYEDELNDEFSGTYIKPIRIDENYKFIHKSMIWNVCSFILQNVLSVPIKLIYPKIKFRLKYVGIEKIKPYKKQGYFIYANHTQNFADTFIPSNPIYPKRNYFIVNPENVSMKFLGNFVQMLGAIPIPDNKKAMENFQESIKQKINRGHAITIYPEGHIWPYYTKIRPFKDVSFTYPVKLSTPVFSMTNTYQSYGKKNNKIQLITYIDGPFFPNDKLSIKEQKQDLRNMVYNSMLQRSQNSNIEYIKYIKKEKGL